MLGIEHLNNRDGIKEIMLLKRHFLSLVLILVSPLSYSADDVEESPPAIGCAGCSNNQSMIDEWNRSQMEKAAAAAEAQKALAAQQQAQARAAALEAERRRQAQDCGSRKGSIAGSLSGCKATASTAKSRAYNSCPAETEIISGGVKTEPRKTCIQNADAAFSASIDTCDAAATNALAALPSYCF